MIDWNKLEKTIGEMSKANVPMSSKRIIRLAESAWLSNRKAVQLIDLKNDGVQGERELLKLRKSIMLWIAQLEETSNAAKRIATRASETVYASGRNIKPEEDSER